MSGSKSYSAKTVQEQIIYTIIAKQFYDCRFSELRDSQRPAVINWWEDNKELAYQIWKRGHRIWNKKKNGIIITDCKKEEEC